MISFVLFSQASQPNKNFNISELVYWAGMVGRDLSPSTKDKKIIFPYVGDQLSQVKKIITSPTKQQEVQCNNKH